MAKAATNVQESEDKSVAIATAKGLTASVPDFLKGYAGPTGAESIEAGDVNVPRLKLGQGLTPEVKDGLVHDGDMFHSITKQVLIPKGEAGIFTPIAYVKEYILWNDMNNGGGIFARAHKVVENGRVRYKWDNANQTFKNKVRGVVPVDWTTKEYVDEDGLDKFGSSIPADPKSVPAATEHFNYIIIMPELENQVLAISFSRTASRKARDLNAMLKMGNMPMFARRFSITAVPDQNDAGQSFFNYGIIPAGFVQSEDEFNLNKKLFEEFATKSFTVDFEAEAAGGAADEAERQKGF